ncbi:hypothetical protein L210DRAFT_3654613 [Boletus edulis BED1]|uniref:Uncharacterized protein n=1 Tax=Boletus edulis BED1 TaxID=1328754 RepID=A0AAD4BDW4_BOLED|nr:hypothetical protein L210DRAFT_3654613 [Boletus edulis BED1]
MAKSVAYVGSGDKDKGDRTCDIAFEHFHSSHVTFLLLIKAIIVFMAGEHIDAISRLDDLIATVRFNSVCYTVQAYMHYLLGCSHMQRSDYDRAIHSFEHARPVSRFLSIAFALVASDVVQGAFRQEIQLQFEGGLWQRCTVQRMPRVHDTLRALMMPTDTIRGTFDLR